MTKLRCYFHGGSENHGCEAIVRATAAMFDPKPVVYTFNQKQDEAYGLHQLLPLKEIKKLGYWSLKHILFYILKRLTGTNKRLVRYVYRPLLQDANGGIALSLGGDTYCYEKGPDELADVNCELTKRGVQTVLWGCSIEPAQLKKAAIVKDLKRYSLITARESITYEALLQAGVTKNLHQYPDPAFTLQTVCLPLPEGFIEGNTLGLNISPMVMENEKQAGIVKKNYERLIEYTLQHTSMSIALIPHVVWAQSDDRVPLRAFYDAYRSSGRVVLIGDHDCMQLKGYIARCRYFVAARTHASIAAYSSCVPTLVAGYSVKARGIAKDIFGTQQNYVLPVQSMQRQDDLTRAFIWMTEHEHSIRERLHAHMPGYIARAAQAKEAVYALTKGAK
jgi:colanic acid/amylovoran biosynthesis protein